MKYRWKKTARYSFGGALTFALASVPGTYAQDDEEEVFELSPFTVTGEDDRGYEATSTLAGTRIRTNLKDLASPISIVTEQFLEDTGATSTEDLLLYTGNTEVAGPDGNYGGGDAQRTNPNTARVRGLGNPDRTRNYFLTDIGFDSYNTNRVAVAKGPNAMLFGLGSPAGIINNNLKEAVFSDENRLQLRLGSWESHREVIDLNRVLIEDQLAVRLIGLNDQAKFKQEPAYDDKQRLYGAITYKPLEKTTIKANFELGSRDAARPRTSSPTSNIPNWVKDGMPTTTGNYNQVGFGGYGGNRAPQFIYDSPTATEPSLGFDPAPATKGPDGITRSHYTYVNREDEGGNGFSNGVLTDDTRWVFDFRNQSLGGIDNTQEISFDVFNITVEQELTDKAGIQLSYNDETHYRFTRDRVENNIRVDASTYLPYFVSDGAGGTMDPLNPYVGRPYVTMTERMSGTESMREALELKGYYDIDFAETTDGMGWLGRHVFTGVYAQQSRDVLRWGNSYGSSITGEAESVLEGNRNRDFTAASWDRRGQGKRYLGPAITGIPSSGHVAQGVMTGGTPRLNEFQAWMYDASATPIVDGHNGAYREVNATMHVDPITSASIDRQEIDSLALTAQSFFFNNNLVVTAGWREDEASSFRDGRPTTTADNIALVESLELPGDPDDVTKDSVFSYGVVGHVPSAWTDRMGISLSAHYGESENFVPSPGRVSLLNVEHPDPKGETTEYGFAVGAFEDKLHLKVNWYETISKNQTDNSLGPGNIPNWERLFYNNVRNSLQEMELRDPEDPSQGYWPNNINWADTYTLPPLGMRELFWNPVEPDPGVGGTPSVSDSPNPNVTGVSDFSSEGLEIEGVWNPTTSWTIAFNATQNEVIKTNVLKSYLEYFNIREPQWVAMGDLIARPNTYKNENPQTIYERTRNVQWKRLLEQVTQDGALSHEIREWRYNISTNYRFSREGKMKGWSVGGAWRWQDEVAVGFRNGFIDASQYGATGLDDVPVVDVTQPIYAPSTENLDLWFAYKRKIFDDKVDWRIQLNVRNVLDNDDLIVTAVDPDGLPTRVRIMNPMNFMLTSTFDF
ncbi:TonB-dependent receptor [Pelagicoccus mobilis]|uniref:TonB-dependent receptor n=1 Tax=Pelagicoccus mobilis TaxID=415221 RepID=A0A934VSM0_9BACT|nr:TonB-dependent receptor [Pelagicoccus mobilis]MBK1878813.1 TonB-dependent receptor [Pelagicoccus mobilis]